MTLHVNNSGTFIEPDEVFVKDGGAWRAITETYVNDNGTWRKIFPESGSQTFTTGTTSFVVPQGVYSINAMSGQGKKMKEITVNRYLNLLKLPVIKKEEYFWISNGYLYVSNSALQAVRFVALFEEDVPNNIMYPECGCGTPSYTTDQLCQNPLDKEFALPGYLEKQVLDLTSQKLLQSYFNLKTDMTDDGIDGQSPNSPQFR